MSQAIAARSLMPHCMLNAEIHFNVLGVFAVECEQAKVARGSQINILQHATAKTISYTCRTMKIITR